MNQTASCNLLYTHTFFMGVTAENPKDSDCALARAAASGELAAVGDLYNRHSRRVYSLCLRMTRNAADAEDLTQEVFINILRKIGSFRGEGQFTTWLYRLTVNQVLMYFRRVRVRKENLVEDMAAEIIPLQRSRHSISPQFVNKIALDAALAQVPPGCRLIFILHDMEGYNHEEIARMLGCTAGNSKSQLHKARLKLKLFLNSKRPKQTKALTA